MESRGARGTFWRRLVSYVSLCFFEALLVAVLIYLHFAVVLPYGMGGREGAYACAAIGFLFLAPIFWMGGVVFCLLAKIAVVAIPPHRRHWALAVYWGATAALLAYAVLDDRHRPAPGPSFDLFHTIFFIPALVLTFSHFVLLPRIPAGTSGSALAAIFRRRPPPTAP